MNFKDFLKTNKLVEGTWSLPDTPAKKKALNQLLSKPLSAKEAPDKLYHLFGDDRLFDMIGNISRKDGPMTDVSKIVFDWLKDNEVEF